MSLQLPEILGEWRVRQLLFGAKLTHGFSSIKGHNPSMDIATAICNNHYMHNVFVALRSAFALAFLSLPAQANEVLLTKNNITQIRPAVWAATGLRLPEPDADLPIVGPQNRQDGVRLLRLYNGKGSINGFRDVLYDNRDRGHSTLDPELYPSLTQLKYGSDLSSEGLDFGLAGRFFLPAVVFGNSSAAVEGGSAPRSLPRLAMTNPFWRAVTPTLYSNNHIYVYPEHRDHDAADLFPANWPYMIASQGSSGSDRKFLNAIAMTLAVLPRETFVFLKEEGLIAPTIQMLLRRNLSTVSSREDYLTGVAHPAAFDPRHVQIGQMLAQAADLRPEDVPPLVRLRVTDENFSKAAGLAKLDERLFDTPAAIGRLWRNFAWERELTVSAEDTSAPNDRPLTFEWRLLRGDPERVWIEPQGADGRVAKIRVAWHDPWSERVLTKKKREIERRFSRIDIGVFANNGIHDSAPSLISIDFPEHQLRTYAPGADGNTRLVSIDYDARAREAYFDPTLYWSAPWTDKARYDEGDVLLGWDRRYSEDGSEEFVPDDSEQRTVQYEIDRSSARTPTLRPTAE